MLITARVTKRIQTWSLALNFVQRVLLDQALDRKRFNISQHATMIV